MIIFQKVFKLQSGHRNIKGEITQKVLKRELLFLYATHRHDPFYITVKYNQNIPNGLEVIEQTRKCLWMDLRTDGRQAHRYIPRTFRSGDKNIYHGFPACMNKFSWYIMTYVLQTSPFSVQLLRSQLPHEGLAVAFLLGADCSPELYCHHNSHSCIALNNMLYICCETFILL